MAAHRARQEEAGKGQARAAVGVAWLVAIVALAWFLAPLASDLAAMRPRLAQGAAELGRTAVNQAAPIAPAAVIVTPTPFPKLGEPTPAPTAVPDIAVTFTDSTGAGLLRIEEAGRVWELTPARLVDCINAQQNGQPTGPTCPPNAAKWAGMLGQGR